MPSTDEPDLFEEPESALEATEDACHSPDGALRWPAPDRDSPQIGSFEGRYSADPKIGVMLKMDGEHGRSESDVERITQLKLKRPRRWHKLFERMGILYPGEGKTRLARLGRMLRDAAEPDGLRRLITREVLATLIRYQFDNPYEKGLPDGNDVHPYYAVLRAASLLGGKIHWDEVNREIMRMMHDSELDEIVKKIRLARTTEGYDSFIGKASNAAGVLHARTHPAEEIAPEGKTPEGQLRDQRMTPFLKRVGFGELLLASPGNGGGGYWSIPPEVSDLIKTATENPPEPKHFESEEDWIEWFCEGTSSLTVLSSPPVLPQVKVAITDLTLQILKDGLAEHEPALVFSDQLLASIVAALRAGDGRNFFILRGVSGTGKSRLIAALAKAIYGTPEVDMPYLTIIEVRPDWIDGSPLLGHYDPIGCRYVRQRFLDALVAADADKSRPVFVCLDEMNLARVEYYLADCLSAMESGNPLHLDTRDSVLVPKSIKWPANVFLFGTVNVDESTLKISDKVLDRAQVIDTSEIDLLPLLNKWLESADALDKTEKVKTLHIVGEVWKILRSVQAHFGYRTGRAIIRFVNEAKASSGGAMSVDEAIDAQLCQKVLVKLRGEGERWTSPLSALELLLKELSGKGSAIAVVCRMRQDLERLGSFQFWN